MARNRIRQMWDRLSGLPGGKLIFSRAIGLYVPYTGSIGAMVEDLRDGHARASLTDRRAVRNHLNCVHALALANLAELTGNLGMIYGAPADSRFIVASLNIDYLKKARGTITATSTFEPPRTNERKEYLVPVELHDLEQVLVARCVLRTLVGPTK
jgi:acyl-coenzyme A thioesterase PaaI-like protein